MSKRITAEHLAALKAAIANGSIVVCTAKCWPCQTGKHYDPPKRHPWWNADDLSHAIAIRQPAPSGDCGCHCAEEARP